MIAERALRHAEALMRAGNYAAAIEPLRDVLTADPENDYGHDRLAECLLMQSRLAGAVHEARAAIALQPQVSDYRLTLASALFLQQHSRQALKEVDAAIALDPQNGAAHLARARFLRIKGDRSASARSLERAQELAPGDGAVLAEAGYAALERGMIAEVEDIARAILSGNPDDLDGLVLMGRARLARHDTDEAMRLSLSALSQNPSDLEALSLLAATKMKKSWLGGLWWRWNRFLVRLGETRAIFVVVAIWLLYRWALLGIHDAGLPEIAEMALTIIYLAFVLYTISANVIVTRMVLKEIERVRLDPKF